MSDPALLRALRLVVILDADAARGRDLAWLAAAAERGGATMLQVRGKPLGAGALAELARAVLGASRLPVLVNDRLDVALAVGAAGCHLGQQDLPLPVARAMAPSPFILGGSAGTEAEARSAAAAGAHYLGIGPVNATPSKADAGSAIGVDGFALLARAGGLPAVAIGGVRAADAEPLVRAGAAGVAVISAVLGADRPEAAARELCTALESALR